MLMFFGFLMSVVLSAFGGKLILDSISLSMTNKELIDLIFGCVFLFSCPIHFDLVNKIYKHSNNFILFSIILAVFYFAKGLPTNDYTPLSLYFIGVIIIMNNIELLIYNKNKTQQNMQTSY